jgi:N-acetyl-anhydromuramyl-L-alanine amidase AmpD
MRKIDLFVIHCSSTQSKQDIGYKEIYDWHVNKNKWKDVGYHFIIRRNGVLEKGRPIEQIGAHTQGHNANSIGICMVGGIDKSGKSQDNFTEEQYDALRQLLQYDLLMKFPKVKICGHRDLSPDVDGDGIVEKHEWVKDCPSFSVQDWLNKIHLAYYFNG